VLRHDRDAKTDCSHRGPRHGSSDPAGVALLAYGSAAIKFTLSYEHLWETPALDNDILTAQLQARF